MRKNNKCRSDLEEKKNHRKLCSVLRHYLVIYLSAMTDLFITLQTGLRTIQYTPV